MEKVSEAFPPPAIKEPAPFGNLSTLPQEIRLQIYDLLLSASSLLRKAIRSYFETSPPEEALPATSHNLVNVAIMQVSRAISAEAMDVFYSINRFHIGIPAGFPQNYKPTAVYDVEPRAKRTVSWIFALPSQRALDHIRDLKISFHSCILDESKENDMSEDSVSTELVRKLQKPNVLRNMLTIEIFRFRQARTPLMKAHFFQNLATLTDFEAIEFNVNGGIRRAFAPYMNRVSLGRSPHYNDFFCEDPSIAIGAIKKEFESIWGPASVRRDLEDCFITFKPRPQLGRSRLESET